jgi:4-diphosphocytidyl-2-C-methyl-D-erythritol kinase
LPEHLSEAAPAKVNLFLHVLGWRPDGYHTLDSLAVFAGIGDRLSFIPADTFSLTVEGPFAAALAGESDNLVLRAGRMLATEIGQQPHGHLVLHKYLPVASGIGGGSSDAAAALRLLSRAWHVSDDAMLQRLAAKLGADVPVCLAARAVRMGGIGERLEQAPLLPACGIALVNPGVPLGTASVFAARRAEWSQPAVLPNEWRSARRMAADLAQLRNDLQPAAASIAPVITEVLAALTATPGCLLARMSGSGATCFALYEASEAATRAAAELRATHSAWWCWGGGLRTA